MRERWHGTFGGYTNHACRCDDCRRANTDAHLAARVRRAGSPATPHGTYNGYLNYSCRCAECRAANAAYARGVRARG